jgi:hypothetical protein
MTPQQARYVDVTAQTLTRALAQLGSIRVGADRADLREPLAHVFQTLSDVRDRLHTLGASPSDEDRLVAAVVGELRRQLARGRSARTDVSSRK